MDGFQTDELSLIGPGERLILIVDQSRYRGYLSWRMAIQKQLLITALLILSVLPAFAGSSGGGGRADSPKLQTALIVAGSSNVESLGDLPTDAGEYERRAAAFDQLARHERAKGEYFVQATLARVWRNCWQKIPTKLRRLAGLSPRYSTLLNERGDVIIEPIEPPALPQDVAEFEKRIALVNELNLLLNSSEFILEELRMLREAVANQNHGDLSPQDTERLIQFETRAMQAYVEYRTTTLTRKTRQAFAKELRRSMRTVQRDPRAPEALLSYAALVASAWSVRAELEYLESHPLPWNGRREFERAVATGLKVFPMGSHYSFVKLFLE